MTAIALTIAGSDSGGGSSLVGLPMSPRALGQRYGLEIDPQRVPVLPERVGLRIGQLI